MARRLREDSPGTTHHVCNRGIAGRALFVDDEDREFFHALVARWSRELALTVLGWSMPINHVHLLLTRGERSIADFMHFVMSAYSTYFNRKYGCVGHVVQRRYESRRIEDDGDLRWILAYALGNTVRHHITTTSALGGDQNSGYAGAMGLRPPFQFESWELALRAFDDDIARAREALHELIAWAEANQWKRDRSGDIEAVVDAACARNRVEHAALRAKTPAAYAARAEIAAALKRMRFGRQAIASVLGVSAKSATRALKRARREGVTRIVPFGV